MLFFYVFDFFVLNKHCPICSVYIIPKQGSCENHVGFGLCRAYCGHIQLLLVKRNFITKNRAQLKSTRLLWHVYWTFKACSLLTLSWSQSLATIVLQINIPLLRVQNDQALINSPSTVSSVHFLVLHGLFNKYTVKIIFPLTYICRAINYLKI